MRLMGNTREVRTAADYPEPAKEAEFLYGSHDIRQFPIFHLYTR